MEERCNEDTKNPPVKTQRLFAGFQNGKGQSRRSCQAGSEFTPKGQGILAQ